MPPRRPDGQAPASRRSSWPHRLYRFLLRSYPSDFREEYAAEMEDAFREQCEDARRTRGLRATLALWRDIMLDTLRVAPGERLALLAQDLRICLRSLRRSAGFTTVVVLTLGLGIGATTAIFTIVNGVLLRPLPYPEPDRLAAIFINFDQPGMSKASFSMADFIDARAHTRAFTAFAMYRGARLSLTDSGGEPALVATSLASGDFFGVLGVQPLAGRLFRHEDEEPGHPRVAVLSEGLWQQRYGRDPRVLGRTIALNGSDHQIVGIARGDLRFPDRDTQLWAILPVAPPSRRGPYFFSGIGRLAPGTPIEQAQAQLGAVPRGERNGSNPKQQTLKFTIVNLREQLVGDSRPVLLLLFSAVACVLLIAVANVANLMLVRGASRRRDIAIRVSLGASRGQLARHLLTESLLLGAAGGALGLVLTWWGVAVLHTTAAAHLPRADDVRIDLVALAFAFGTSLVASVGLGLLPAGSNRLPRLSEAMSDGGRGTTAATRRLRKAFVIAEICLSFVLLVSAGLLLRSFVRLQQAPLGVDPDHVLTMRLSLSGARYEQDPAVMGFFDQLVTNVRALPGVTSAGTSSVIPPGLGGFSENFTIEGRTGEDSPIVTMPIVGPSYFRTMGIPVLRGRAFTDADLGNGPRVAIISRTMARQFFADQDPIGKHLKQGGPERPQAPWREIVGVVDDVQYRAVDREPEPVFYEAHAQNVMSTMYLIVRTAMAPAQLTGAIRAQVRQLDPGLPVPEAATLEALVAESVAQPRFRTVLVGGFAAAAALLALLGIYGVIAYSVLERSQEIGIRLALGAPRARIVRHVLGECSLLLAAGLGLGLPAALAMAGLLARFLFGVTPWDAATFAIVSIALVCCGLLASALPARRAARVDPLAMLR
jgi:putative ABC transport system permease protein